MFISDPLDMSRNWTSLVAPRMLIRFGVVLHDTLPCQRTFGCVCFSLHEAYHIKASAEKMLPLPFIFYICYPSSSCCFHERERRNSSGLRRRVLHGLSILALREQQTVYSRPQCFLSAKVRVNHYARPLPAMSIGTKRSPLQVTPIHQKKTSKQAFQEQRKVPSLA